jgi:hypothetical protein
MRMPLISVFLFLVVVSFGQQNQKPKQLKKTDYPLSKFLTISDTFLLRHVQIIITMASPKDNSNAQFLCRSWLTIKKNGKILEQKFYDIEPLGGCSGLYAPAEQPLKDIFVISKFGDYEGETLIIDTTGKATTISGGSFFVSPDSKFLFSIWDSDVSGVSVYNLTTKNIILEKESETESRFAEIYFQDGKYYTTFDEQMDEKEIICQFDFKTKKIISINKSASFLKKQNKLKIFNDVQGLQKCNCGQK